MSPPNFIDLRAGSRTLEKAAADTEQGYTLTDAGAPERLRGAPVTDQSFQVLGVPPALGRPFRSEESQPGHAIRTGTRSSVSLVTDELFQTLERWVAAAPPR